MATNDDILAAVNRGKEFNFDRSAELEAAYAKLRTPPQKPQQQKMTYKQCYDCGNTFPPADLVARTIEVEVGRTSGAPNISGSLFSLGDKPGKSIRVGYSAGRTHYRNKTVFVCKNCIRAEKVMLENHLADEKNDRNTFLIVFVILCFIIYLI